MTITQDFWNGINGDNWTDAADWSPGSGSGHAAPTSSQDAFIDYKGVGSATVVSSASETVNSIGTNLASALLINDSTFVATNGTTTNPADIGTVDSGNIGQITAADGSTLEIGQGTFDNSGTVELKSTGTPTSFSVANSVMLTGGGNIEMSPNSSNLLKGAGGASSLTNVNNTISGGGQIGAGFNALAFTNDSTIETNNSLGTGTLQIVGSENGGSFVNNGNVTAQDGGTIVFGVDGESSTIVNTDFLNLDGGGDFATFKIAGNTTISAPSTGTNNYIALNDLNDTPLGANFINSDGKPATLTLVNQTLKGAGSVGDNNLTLDNSTGSTIIANDPGTTLFLNTGSNTINNAGTLEAADLSGDLDGGGTLSISFDTCAFTVRSSMPKGSPISLLELRLPAIPGLRIRDW